MKINTLKLLLLPIVVVWMSFAMLPAHSAKAETVVCNDGTEHQAPYDCSGASEEGVKAVRDCEATEGVNQLNAENCGIIKYLNTALNFVAGGVTLGVIGYIIWGGIEYSTAQGDPAAAAKAKKRIRDGLLAFLMYLSLYGFIQWLVPGGVF